MMALGQGELVQVSSFHLAGAPSEFLWRGRRHEVRSIERCHTDRRASALGSLEHRTYRLRTTGGLRCTLTQDVSSNRWQMEGVHP
jgi:hypothetical protein